MFPQGHSCLLAFMLFLGSETVFSPTDSLLSFWRHLCSLTGLPRLSLLLLLHPPTLQPGVFLWSFSLGLCPDVTSSRDLPGWPYGR